MEKVDIVYSQEQLKAQAGAWRLLNYRIVHKWLKIH